MGQSTFKHSAVHIFFKLAKIFIITEYEICFFFVLMIKTISVSRDQGTYKELEKLVCLKTKISEI